MKSIPEERYTKLKASAEAHRRSLNGKAIVCFESVLLPGKMPPTERLDRARALRASLPQGKFRSSDIDLLKREAMLAGNEHEVDSKRVLELVRDSACTAYDCEFIALGLQLGAKVVPMDGKLLKAFPQHTLSLSAA